MQQAEAVNAAVTAAVIVSIMFLASPAKAQSSTPVGETVTEHTKLLSIEVAPEGQPHVLPATQGVSKGKNRAPEELK